MEIVEYQQKYKKYFIEFNTDWIKDNFGALEAEDLNTFQHIEESLEEGAMIYFALEEGNVLATCMAKPLDKNGTWELCKLGSNKHLKHKGAGSAVFGAAMDWAIHHGANRMHRLNLAICPDAFICNYIILPPQPFCQTHLGIFNLGHITADVQKTRQ